MTTFGWPLLVSVSVVGVDIVVEVGTEVVLGRSLSTDSVPVVI
jgi:hypothetical protein